MESETILNLQYFPLGLVALALKNMVDIHEDF